jgi:hypothetical protein
MQRHLASSLLLAVLAGIIGSATVDFATAQDKAKSKAGETASDKPKETKAVTVNEVYKDSAGEFRSGSKMTTPFWRWPPEATRRKPIARK